MKTTARYIYPADVCLYVLQVSNMFIMSLAAADLIVGVFVMPLGSLYAIKGG